MIQEITIENYKSIQSLSIELGRVTVFIGENGCGKSNILEAIALGSAAAADKLDNEFLASRGIRVTDPKLMRSAFNVENLDKKIKIHFRFNNNKFTELLLQNNNASIYSPWFWQLKKDFIEDTEIIKLAKKAVEITRKKAAQIQSELPDISQMTKIEKKAIQQIEEKNKSYDEEKVPYHAEMKNFLLFCPQIYGLKSVDDDRQIQPLGIHGEGLFKYLHYLSQPQFKEKLDQIKEKLELIDWFENFEIPDNSYPGERTLKLKDRYLNPDLEYFDQKSANEGFLFLLFYFCLFIGEETPNFFAIDNIDNSLNPRLCRRLIQELVELAKKYDKQVILTTHNPAVLDGLNLDDPEQKLYVINRKRSGHTRADQISSPKPLEGQELVPLSEAFLRGYIGGLPKNF
jgi:predicted ATPase